MGQTAEMEERQLLYQKESKLLVRPLDLVIRPGQERVKILDH